MIPINTEGERIQNVNEIMAICDFWPYHLTVPRADRRHSLPDTMSYRQKWFLENRTWLYLSCLAPGSMRPLGEWRSGLISMLLSHRSSKTNSPSCVISHVLDILVSQRCACLFVCTNTPLCCGWRVRHMQGWCHF